MAAIFVNNRDSHENHKKDLIMLVPEIMRSIG
jgi:hypothetical protein